MRWFEAPARTAAPKGHHLHLLRSTAFNPRITYTRIRPPALVAHLFSDLILPVPFPDQRGGRVPGPQAKMLARARFLSPSQPQQTPTANMNMR